MLCSLLLLGSLSQLFFFFLFSLSLFSLSLSIYISLFFTPPGIPHLWITLTLLSCFRISLITHVLTLCNCLNYNCNPGGPGGISFQQLKGLRATMSLQCAKKLKSQTTVILKCHLLTSTRLTIWQSSFALVLQIHIASDLSKEAFSAQTLRSQCLVKICPYELQKAL